MVFNRIRELVGHPGEVVNKAHLYDQMVESTDPSSAWQTLPILVKYSQTMKDLLKEIQKVVPPEQYPLAGALLESTQNAHRNVVRGDRRG